MGVLWGLVFLKEVNASVANVLLDEVIKVVIVIDIF